MLPHILPAHSQHNTANLEKRESGATPGTILSLRGSVSKKLASEIWKESYHRKSNRCVFSGLRADWVGAKEMIFVFVT